MNGKHKFLGKVTLTQLQPDGLIIDRPSGEFYDHTRLMAADHLIITPLGIETITANGERVLDIHHIEHPKKAYDPDDLVCIGFTSHYAAMRARFGEHLQDGTAGENIIIDNQEEIWLEQLGKQIAIENQTTGALTYLDVGRFAAPCEEFTHFVANSQDKRLPAKELKDALQFLGNGRRGFLLLLSQGQEKAIVQPGDNVYLVK